MTTRIDIDKLLEHIDLVSLAKHLGAELKEQGREWRGACPIHAGASNTSAFQIYTDNDKRGRWRCWSGCDTGGDAITLVRMAENMDFLAAVKYLAEYARLDLEEIGMTAEAAKSYEERQQRTDVLNLAARYYAEGLWTEDGKGALAYAQGRGFNDDALRMAGWGFSDGGTGLRDFLEGVGADMGLVRKIGLVRADGRDFTANGNGDQASPEGWLIFPHREYVGVRERFCEQCQEDTWHSGKGCLLHEADFSHLRSVVYLSARALNPSNEKDKSRNLPGRDARQLYKAEIPSVREIMLCEGQADAESFRQMGFSAWALCGLGNIPERDMRLLNQRPVVYLTLDGDKEGQEKQEQISPELGPLAMLMEPFEEAKDANDFLMSDGTTETVNAMCKAATPVIEKRIAAIADATPQELQRITGEIVGLLNQLPRELEPRYLQKAQRAMGMTRRELRGLMSGIDQNKDGQVRVLSDVKEGQLSFLGEPLGNFSAEITHELTVDDGLNLPEVHYTVAGRLANGGPLRPITVEAREFADMRWISQYWGARPIVFIPHGKRYLLVRAIQEVSICGMEQKRVYTHTGWTDIDGVRSFLTASGRISADGFRDDVSVDLGANNLRHYALPQPPKGEALATAVKASLDFLKLGPLSVMAPIWAAMYTAPLTEIKPLYGIIWIYGSTQSGKSTVAHLALTHFGTGFISDRQYHAPDDWISTVTHIEGVLFKTKDTPAIIDDYAPQFQSTADARQMARTAHRIVRSVGNRSARGRYAQNMQERQTRVPRGLVLATAELPLTGQSTVGRMIYLPIQRGDVLPDTGIGEIVRPEIDRAQEQAQQGMYAEAMAAYIQWLASNWDEAMQTFDKTLVESYSLARARDGMQNRLPDYFALLDASQQLALSAFQDMGLLSAHDAATIAHENSQAILDIIAHQAEKIAAESPVRKLFEALDNLLERGKVYLAPRTQRVISFTPPSQADKIGWFEPGDKSVVYINDATCLEHARGFWASLGEHFDTTTDALRRQMSQVPNLLHETGGGKNIPVAKWVEGKTRRVLAIDAQTVLQLYGITLSNEALENEETHKIDDVPDKSP